MSNTRELVARMADAMVRWCDVDSTLEESVAQFRDLAAEARATEQGQGDDLAPPTSHADLLAMGEAMTGGHTSDMIDPPPAPCVVPRRWWLVIDADGNVSVANAEETAREWAMKWSMTDKITYTVVAVVEASALEGLN